jgi:hypothetical protein
MAGFGAHISCASGRGPPSARAVDQGVTFGQAYCWAKSPSSRPAQCSAGHGRGVDLGRPHHPAYRSSRNDDATHGRRTARRRARLRRRTGSTCPYVGGTRERSAPGGRLRPLPWTLAEARGARRLAAPMNTHTPVGGCQAPAPLQPATTPNPSTGTHHMMRDHEARTVEPPHGGGAHWPGGRWAFQALVQGRFDRAISTRDGRNDPGGTRADRSALPPPSAKRHHRRDVTRQARLTYLRGGSGGGPSDDRDRRPSTAFEAPTVPLSGAPSASRMRSIGVTNSYRTGVAAWVRPENVFRSRYIL